MKVSLLLIAVLLGGCSMVTPSDQQIISANASNARAMDASTSKYTYIQVDSVGTTQPAPYVNQWFKAEAKTWTWMENWSQSKPATTQP